MSGDDLIGCADTGTGKTAAFLLPILNRMLKARATAPEERGYTRVLILAPTRELAVQIEDDVQGFIYHTDITSIAVYGGVDMGPQERALKSGVDIVVATPGRLMDHMRSKTVGFDKLDTLVLDEADRMMDMGFWPDVRRIVQSLPDSAARQTLLFSATMPEEVMKLADEVVRDAKYVQVGSAGGPAKSITHTIENVAAADKTEWLARFLRRTEGPVLVFMRTKSGAERLARKLSSLRAQGRGAPRRPDAAAADAGGRRVQERKLPGPRRHGRCRARARHRRHHARGELRSAVQPRDLRPPGRTDGPGGRYRNGADTGRPGRIAGAAGAPAILRARIAGMMDDTNPFAQAAMPVEADAQPSEGEISTPASTQGPSPGGNGVAPAASPTLSAAVAKFHSCRWRATPDVGDFCTHRDVLPFAGKEGFVAESWCPECAFYKLRRTPKKRDYSAY